MPQPVLLFVYGTLMTAARDPVGAPMRLRLEPLVRSRGAATMRGRMYHMGGYPGMVDSDEPGDIVHGEVLEFIADAGVAFQWLDPYEGIEPGAASGEYVRAKRPVTLHNGDVREAWVYVYLSDLSSGRHLPSGRWL